MSLRIKTADGDITVADVGGGGSGTSSADKVSYDNTESGIVSDNVQDAIDEIDSKIGDINTILELIL